MNESAPLSPTDPETKREYAYRWGICPACERETLLYVHVSKRYWRCGDCLKPNRRAYT